MLKIFMCLLFFTGWLLRYLPGYWLERNTSYLFYMQRKPWTCVIISGMQFFFFFFFFFFFTYFPSFNVFDILFHLISKLFQLLHEISYLSKLQHIGSVSLANPSVSQLHPVKRIRVRIFQKVRIFLNLCCHPYSSISS